jgi:hypothetical protein
VEIVDACFDFTSGTELCIVLLCFADCLPSFGPFV